MVAPGRQRIWLSPAARPSQILDDVGSANFHTLPPGISWCHLNVFLVVKSTFFAGLAQLLIMRCYLFVQTVCFQM